MELSFYINNRLDWRRHNDLECEKVESIWIKVFVKSSKNILFCVMCSPTGSSSYLPKNFTNFIKNICYTNDLICGIPKQNWQRLSAEPLTCQVVMPTRLQFRFLQQQQIETLKLSSFLYDKSKTYETGSAGTALVGKKLDCIQ